jgi:hypothetical protein
MRKQREEEVVTESKSIRMTFTQLANLFAGFLASGLLVPAVMAQSPAHTAAPAKPVPAVRTNLAKHVPMQAHMYYEGVWGVDSLTVKYTESGEIIRFSYRVLEPEKAAALNDKKSEPSLIDPQAGVKLVVPQMEKIGKLRQTTTPIADKSYWIAFSNSGRRVRPGDRVDVEIGNFRAQGLVVQ